MTATPSWTIHCDGCGEALNSDLGSRTAAEARDVAREDSGASVSAPGGTDWCEECRESGAMKAALQRHYMRRRFRR